MEEPQYRPLSPGSLPIVGAAAGDRAALLRLLEDCGLVGDDVASLDTFLVVRDGDGLAGAVGLDLAGGDALLRSLAVAPARRNAGLGARLVAAAETLARTRGIATVWLLTTTARPLFARLGYLDADRAAAPAAIRTMPQFASLCPASSACMRKALAA